MARYNLILKDSDYVALVLKAQELKLSFGKYVNIILHEAGLKKVEDTVHKPLCFICGGKPVMTLTGFDAKYYVCSRHSGINKMFSGWKEVKENAV